ncbi:MAG: c-type cytochrome biogenesis protein CcmI [Gammaproteobacteria bacterium]|nr:c-type cytochrome biogenesis protein CcmI [Gammaproteobacteria bacterium]MDP2140874.1 c-type cytochrome biogenesis protein CcmI [Gammaproteobacteria bacterium]MDP2349382.1 c-type cytochrome biogenesis protein CcmI [Gammaproteobacteria bacterium]
MFWFLAAALVVLAILFVLLPLWQFHRAGDSSRARREQANLLIFQERIAELEAERAAGILEEENFNALKSELQRSLLSDVEGAAPQKTEGAGTASTLSPSRLIPLVMVLLILPASYFLYQQWGYQNELALAQLGERTRESANNPQEARDLIFAIGDIVQAEPDNAWAWYFLAQNLVNLGQFPEAAMSLERSASLIEQPQDKVVVLGQYAFLEYMLAEQQITDKVQGIINEAQLIDPNQLLILQILSMDAEQRQDYQAAITYWRRVLQRTPPGPEADMIQVRIADAQQMLATANDNQIDVASGPTIDVELSLSPELDLPADTRVFVSALELNGRGQPLAAEVLTVGDLPTTITLDNSDAVGPFNISSAEMVYIVATASSSGTANVQSGDYQTRTEAFAHINSHAIIQLVIKDIVP